MNEVVEGFQNRLRAELPFLTARYQVSSLGLFGS
jgi:hypothetical protein